MPPLLFLSPASSRKHISLSLVAVVILPSESVCPLVSFFFFLLLDNSLEKREVPETIYVKSKGNWEAMRREETDEE